MSMESGPAVGNLRPLAEGPTATVYVGRSAETGAEVAVKMFAERIDRDTEALLDRERAALDSVRSVRSILPVDGVVSDGAGRSGVRMELCQGSLAGLLAARGAQTSPGALTVPEALAVGSAVAVALAAAHGAGVLHGAVTPGNVLFRSTGEVALADFGLALRQRFPRDSLYAVEFTAPEALRDATQSTATDLYGLGAVLYQALTGTSPFPKRTGQRQGERILQVLHEPVPPIRSRDIPFELSTMVGQLLAKDPAERPRDAATVAEVFRNLTLSPSHGSAAPNLAQPGEIHPEPDAEQPADADFDFDDFPETGQPEPAARTQSEPDRPTPPPTPGRTPVATFHPEEADSRGKFGWTTRRTGILVGVGAAVVGLIAVPLLLFRSGSADQPRPGATGTSGPAVEVPVSSEPPPTVNLKLDAPTDEGTAVQLNWSADGDLDYAVVVAGERVDTMVLVANRQHTMRVPVDPARGYCFQIRATDGRHVYTTDPAPIRGAHCKL